MHQSHCKINSCGTSKRSLRRTAVTLATLLLAASACAGSSKQQQGSSSNGALATAPTDPAAKVGKPKVICEMEREVGSNIPRRVCRTPEQRERERDEAQRTLQGSPPSN